MYEQTLFQAGLTSNQAVIYEILLKNGSLPAGKISLKSRFKRGLTYKILEELISLGLIEKKEEKGKIAIFKPSHPLKLQDLAEHNEEKAKNAKLALSGVISSLISDFNLVSGRPGVRFFEGLEGIKKVLDDTIYNNQEKKLFTFSDVAGYVSYLEDWNVRHYAPERKKLSIYEKVIIPDNTKALDYMKSYTANEFTDIIFIDHNIFPFSTEINIYDQKVSLVTFSDKTHIGVIIENQAIADTLKSVFNFCWNFGKKLLKDDQPEWMKKQWKEENKEDEKSGGSEEIKIKNNKNQTDNDIDSEAKEGISAP